MRGVLFAADRDPRLTVSTNTDADGADVFVQNQEKDTLCVGCITRAGTFLRFTDLDAAVARKLGIRLDNQGRIKEA